MESYNKKQCAPTDNTNVRPISMETKQSIASMGIVLSIQADVKASLLEVRRNCHCCDNHCCDIVATCCFRRTILLQYLKVCTSVTLSCRSTRYEALQPIRHNRKPSLPALTSNPRCTAAPVSQHHQYSNIFKYFLIPLRSAL